MGESIEDFIPYYPDIENENFTYELARKKEFAEFDIQAVEEVPTIPGELLKTQKVVQRIFSGQTPYNSCLFYHEMGTGKSCTASAIVETGKHMIYEGMKRGPALVFTKNEDIQRSIIKDIINVCTFEVYKPKATSKELKMGISMTDMAKVHRMNKAISRTYEFVTFEKFLRMPLTEEEIKRKYSGRVIIVDEAHTLRIQPTKITKKDDDLEGDDDPYEQEIEGENSRPKNSASLYQTMHDFLHFLPDSPKFLLSGTPIWDRVSEIASLMNLILDKNEQLPTKAAFTKKFFSNGELKNEEELIEVFRGRVSYLRQMSSTAKKIEMGVKKPYTKYTTVYPDYMSKLQTLYAKTAKTTEETRTVKIRGKQEQRTTTGGTILKLARDAANLVYPVSQDNIVYGQEEFNKNIVTKITIRSEKSSTIKTGYSIKNEYARRQLRENLKEYSAKFHSIVEDIKAHPDQLLFIYSEEVTGFGGAIMLGLILELHNFRRVIDKEGMATKSKEKRFAIFTSDPTTTSDPKKTSELINAINQPDNSHGEKLQIIIGSEKISMGITLKNIRRVHIVMPHWTAAQIDQAESRPFRVGSHDNLPKAERTLTIFRHVAVYPKEDTSESVDLHVMRIAEDKEHDNVQIYRLLKKSSIDCPIFYKRNVLENDIEASRRCDYQECNYICDAFPEDMIDMDGKVWDYTIPAESLDYSTYNLFYSKDKVKVIIREIVDIFGVYFVLHINKLYTLLNIEPYENNLMLEAIDTIINSRIVIKNKFGFDCYLKEKGNILFLDNNISSTSDYSDSIYVSSLFVTEKTNMTDLIDIMNLEKDKVLIEKACYLMKRGKSVGDIYNKLSYKAKIVLLEYSYLSDVENEISRKLIEEYQDQIFEMEDGKKVHVLYNDEFKGTGYSVAAKDIKPNGTMRILNEELNEWEYIGSRELEIFYISDIKQQLSSKKEGGFENNPYGVYGWVSKKDNLLRIIFKQEKIKKWKPRGRVCTTYKIHELLSILINKLNHFPKPDEAYKSKTKEELMKIIKNKSTHSSGLQNLEQYTTKQLASIITLMSKNVDGLCQELYKWFEKKELLEIS